MKQTTCTVYECTAFCLLLPSTTICELYLCWKSKPYRGEAQGANVTKAVSPLLLMQHCCYYCHSKANE